jgi:hypothetical protein
MKRLHLIFAAGFVCIIILPGVVSSASAQIVNSSRAPTAGQQELKARDHQIETLERERESAKKRAPEEVLAEVNEDLNRLVTLHRFIATALKASDQTLDHKAFVDSATEIKMRGSRLRTDLALPLDEKAPRRDVLKGIDNRNLQPVLETLSKLLESFLRNPVFTDTGAPDMQLAAKARLDLEDIILVSEKMRKTAEKLSKSKSP